MCPRTLSFLSCRSTHHAQATAKGGFRLKPEGNSDDSDSDSEGSSGSDSDGRSVAGWGVECS